MTPDTMTKAAIALPRLNRSWKNSQPITTANKIDVSRNAATSAIGAIVIAQTDMP